MDGGLNLSGAALSVANSLASTRIAASLLMALAAACVFGASLSAKGSGIDYVDIDSPMWISPNGSEIATLEVENGIGKPTRVEIAVKPTHGYTKVFRPTENYVMSIPSWDAGRPHSAMGGVERGRGSSDATARIPEYNYYGTASAPGIPVMSENSMRAVYINLYASFSILHIELYRRPERAKMYVCGREAAHLRDNIYVAYVPITQKICNVLVSNVLGLGIRYELGNIVVEESVSLVIPDFALSVASTVLIWPLIVLNYLACRKCEQYLTASSPRPPENSETYAGLLAAVAVPVTIFSFVRLDLLLGLYFLLYEVLSFVGSAILMTALRLRLAMRRNRAGEQVKPAEKAGRISERPSPAGGKASSEPLDSLGSEALQRLLRTRIKSPPGREPGEAFVVPAEFRNALKIELPNEMRLLGCGAESCVFACGEYAIKIPRVIAMEIKTGFKTPPTLPRKTVESVKSEIEKAFALDHDNIAKLIDYSINPPILVYELADGSLADYEKLDLKTVLLVSIQLSDALRYIHSRGLVHGDLKPSNVLVSRGVVKLGDLSSTTHLLSVVSGAGLQTCTPGYCAPEQSFIDLRKDPRFKGCENRVDIYQLANVILAMLDISPLDGSSWSEEELENRLSKVECENLRDLLRKMLSMEPWSRPPAEEVEKTLVTIWKRVVESEKQLKTSGRG